MVPELHLHTGGQTQGGQPHDLPTPHVCPLANGVSFPQLTPSPAVPVTSKAGVGIAHRSSVNGS